MQPHDQAHIRGCRSTHEEEGHGRIVVGPCNDLPEPAPWGGRDQAMNGCAGAGAWQQHGCKRMMEWRGPVVHSHRARCEDEEHPSSTGQATSLMQGRLAGQALTTGSC